MYDVINESDEEQRESTVRVPFSSKSVRSGDIHRLGSSLVRPCQCGQSRYNFDHRGRVIRLEQEYLTVEVAL